MVTDNNLPAIIDPDAHLSPIWDAKKIKNAMKRKKNGEIRPCLNNIVLILNHSEDYRGMFRYDHFRNANMLMLPPPWVTLPFTPRELNKKDITYLRMALENREIFCARLTLMEALTLVCEENYIGTPNPTRQDKEARLREQIADYIAANPYSNTRAIQKALGIMDKDGKRDHAKEVCRHLREIGYTPWNSRKHGRYWKPPYMATIDAEFTET